MRIIYIYDALCGWCFGFAPVIKKLHDEFRDSMRFEVVSGGMILGSHAGPIGELADYISGAYKQVEKTTGVTFGDPFLKGTLLKGTARFDSFPPSKALKIFKEFKPEKALDFAADIQDAIYVEGIDPKDREAYRAKAENYGVDKNDFEILWSSVDYDVRTREDFIFAQQLNVTGYPSLIFESENTYHVVARGYTPFEVLKERLEDLAGLAELP